VSLGVILTSTSKTPLDWIDTVTLQKYTKEEKEKLGQTVYYVSISALQKCVRRGDKQGALNFAKICWRMEPYRLFSRLFTILYEDCGRDLSALLTFYKYRGGYSNFENIIPLILAMVDAKKSREACLLSYVMRGTGDQSRLDGYAGTPFAGMIELCKTWPQRQFLTYDLWDYGVGDCNFDWTIELAERASKWDREMFCIGSPYWFQKGVFEEGRVYDECEPLIKYDGWLPLESLDAHTRPGKVVFGTYLKYRRENLPPCIDLDIEYGFGNYVFWHEGWKYRNYQPHASSGFEQLNYEMNQMPPIGTCLDMLSPERTQVMQELVLPELQKVRVWYCEKVMKDDFTNMKNAYFDQLLEVAE